VAVRVVSYVAEKGYTAATLVLAECRCTLTWVSYRRQLSGPTSQKRLSTGYTKGGFFNLLVPILMPPFLLSIISSFSYFLTVQVNCRVLYISIEHFSFLVVLVFEQKALCFLGRHSTTYDKSPGLFALGIV
jgi:hypothetical protein